MIIEKVIKNKELTDRFIKVLEENKAPNQLVAIAKITINDARNRGIYDSNIKKFL